MAGLIKEENEADLQAQVRPKAFSTRGADHDGSSCGTRRCSAGGRRCRSALLIHAGRAAGQTQTTNMEIEEVEALSSIYGDEWCVIDEASRIFCIKISSDLEEPKLTACLQIILPSDYPSAAPPIYQINAAWLRGPERVKLANSLEDIYVEHPGESILYLWVERVREFLVEKSQCSGAEHPGKDSTSAEEGVDDDDDEEYLSDFMALKLNTENAHLFMDPGHDEELPLIKHGNPVTDRRSTFQPHLALVVSPRQVKMVLEKLYMNKKIASATHNIYAYRFWTYAMSWLLCPAGMEAFCWALTASSTSTTALETSWWRRATLLQ
ncbi:protein IMPACT isoform X2 [Oryzias latipes]|uniref:protein IMPACT isoform X2 n=1 Tax=Oryzias latipes TaxID=8090 RepID=UPI000CE27B25|nr:protein IMPACT isoform X2 [Oryzias latipes]